MGRVEGMGGREEGEGGGHVALYSITDCSHNINELAHK